MTDNLRFRHNINMIKCSSKIADVQHHFKIKISATDAEFLKASND